MQYNAIQNSNYKDELLLLYRQHNFEEALNQSLFYLKLNKSDYWLINFIGVINFKLSNYNDAIKYFDEILKIDSFNFDALNNKGLCLNKLGNYDQAICVYKIILKRDSNRNYLILNNLGVTLKNLGQIEKSIIYLKKSIRINPNYLHAYNNIAVSLLEMNNLEDAEYYLKKGLLINSNNPDFLNSLGKVYMLKGDLEKSLDCYTKCLALNKNDLSVWGNLGICLLETNFKSYDKNLGELFLQILQKNVQINPRKFAMKSLQFLMLSPDVRSIISNNKRWNLIDINSLNKLCQYKLLLKTLEITPVSDLEFEKFLINCRKFILFNLKTLLDETEILTLSVAIAKQCFLNEYIYVLSKEEKTHLKKLIKGIQIKIKKNQYIFPLEIACISSYQTLKNLKIFDTNSIDPQINELIKEQILDFNEEEKIKNNIKRVYKINNSISKVVKKQYENNPYPRWKEHINPIPYNCFKTYLKNFDLTFDPTLFSSNYPKRILIAGCGTGKQSIETGLTFRQSEITAIDLSKSSLSYAIRKSREIGIENINYMQCDIENIQLLNKKFDFIECVGVLHHMDNPFIGLKKLSLSLKNGGIMFIGLYSENARRDITSMRKVIKKMKIFPSKEGMVKFRQKLILNKKKRLDKFCKWSDFYNLSEFRDLLFHAQEHCFSISKIKDMLDRLGLKFCGFENKKAKINFLINNTHEDLLDLEKWAIHEDKSKDTFRGMYQFWVQKGS